MQHFKVVTVLLSLLLQQQKEEAKEIGWKLRRYTLFVVSAVVKTSIAK